MLPPPELLVPRRVGAAGAAVYPAGSRIGPRLLPDFELVLLVAGSAQLTLDDRTTDLLPGSWVLARPGSRDSYAWDRARLSRHLYVHFDLPPGLAVDGWPQVRHGPAQTEAAAQFRRVLQLADTGPSDPADPHRTTERLALAALLAVVVGGVADPTPAGADGPLARAVAHVRRRWEADGLVPVDREELARAAAVSVAHLSRLFRTEYGIGPARGLEGVRLGRALVLLRDGDMAVREISEAVGFVDQYHFSHRFRAHFGTSPSGYRQAGAAENRPVALPPDLARLAAVLSGDGEAGPQG